jgi:hypothetical protein
MVSNHAGVVLFVRHDVKLSVFILFFYFWLGFFLLGFFLLTTIPVMYSYRRYNSQFFSLCLSVSDDICLALYAGDFGDICQENWWVVFCWIGLSLAELVTRTDLLLLFYPIFSLILIAATWMLTHVHLNSCQCNPRAYDYDWDMLYCNMNKDCYASNLFVFLNREIASEGDTTSA